MVYPIIIYACMCDQIPFVILIANLSFIMHRVDENKIGDTGFQALMPGLQSCTQLQQLM